MSELNLIPYSLKNDIDKKQKLQIAIAAAIGALILLAAGILLPYIVAHSYDNKEADLKRQLDEQVSILNERDSLNSQIQNVSAFITNVDNLIKNKTITYNFIHGLQSLIPGDIVLSNFSYSQGIISMSGISKSYSSPEIFVANLQISKLYKKAKLLSISVDDKTKTCQFLVKIDVQGVTP